MRKLFQLISVLLYASIASAQVLPIKIGYDPTALSSGASSTNVNAATTRVSCSFIPSQSRTINSLQFYTSSSTGSPIAADFRVDVYADSSGNPTGGSLAGGTAGSAPTSGTNPTVTGLSLAVTAGTRYHAVVKNNNASPASNYFNIRYPNSGSLNYQIPQGFIYGAGQSVFGWNVRGSTDSGSSWTNTQSSPSPCVRVCYSGSLCEGYASTTHILDTGNEIRGTQEAGIKCTIPASWPTTNVRSLSFLIDTTGTVPAGGARPRLYTGATTTPTLAATGTTIPAANITSGAQWLPLSFTSAQALTAGTTFRLTLGVVSGGSAGNALLLYETRNDGTTTTTDSHPLKCVNTTTTDGTTFTDGTDLTAGVMLLDSTPFTVSSGGLINSANTNGGSSQ